MSPLLAPERPAPAAAAAPAPVVRRPLLPRLLAAAGVLLVLAGGALAAPRSSGAEVTGPPSLRGDDAPPLTTLDAYGPVGSHVLGYEHDAPVLLEVPVRNDGPLPVTVTAGSLSTERLPLLDVALDAPVRLGPGESGTALLRGALTHCRYYHEREVQVYGALHLTERVLGTERRSVVPLDRPLLVHSPMIVGCPDRALDRQANDRRDGFRAAATG